MKLKERILNLVIVQKFLDFTKRFVPPGFGGLPLYDVSVFFIEQSRKLGFNTRAAAISFNVFLAMPAALIFLCTLVPYLPSAIGFEQELLLALADVVRNPSSYELVSEIVHDFFNTSRGSLLSVSFLTAIFFSSNAMMGIMDTFDKSYFEESRGRFLGDRWMAIKLTALLMVMFIITIALLALQGPLKTFILQKLNLDFPVVRWTIQTLRPILLLTLIYFSIAIIYRFAPAVKQRWRIFNPGAVIACILTVITTLLFSLWVNNFGSYNKVYGSIGTVLILMNLVFFNALILLVGFELNVSISSIKARRMRRIIGEKNEKARQAQIAQMEKEQKKKAPEKD